VSLHDELLNQAERLTQLEPKHPRQASLRRATSTAYYALFHLLIHEATTKLVTDPGLRTLVARAFGHGEMKQACEQFRDDKKVPAHLKTVCPPTLPDDLKTVADAFVRLQEARHEADYDVSRTFNRPDTVALLQTARTAFEAWGRVRDEQIATVFLVNLLLGSKWKR
jgi:hypothetical protein